MIVAARNLNAPVKARPADREIAQAALDKGDHFIAAAVRLQKAVGLEQLEQRVFIIGQTEKPAFLDRPLNRRPLWGKLRIALAFDQFAFVIISFVADGIPAFIAVEIKVALGLHRLPNGLTGFVVILFNCSDKTVKADVERIIHCAEIARHLIGEFARRDALLLSFAGHFEPVLIRARLKTNIAAPQTLETRDNIGRNRFICVANMRATIGIVDRGGDIEGFRHWPAR